MAAGSQKTSVGFTSSYFNTDQPPSKPAAKQPLSQQLKHFGESIKTMVQIERETEKA
jgi:hypothetical protein